MINKTLPVYDYGLTLNELPTEIALFFEIGNCEAKCKGCHSPFLWADSGAPVMDLGTHQLLQIIHRYDEKITAVVFMGGLSNGTPVKDALSIIKSIAIRYPTGLYTDSLHGIPKEGLTYLRWLKVGRYDDERGGLQTNGTNQVFYTNVNGEWKDETEAMFQYV